MAWRELNKTWHDTTVDYCDVCGNLLIRRYWSFDGADGEAVRACRRDDERLYHTLRRYRADAATNGAAAEARS
jgi:hypothetical protein